MHERFMNLGYFIINTLEANQKNYLNKLNGLVFLRTPEGES